MTTLGKTAIVTVILLLTIPGPASAGCRGNCGDSGGPGWGAVVGAGILGGVLGGIAAPQPQPQQIIIVVPPAPAAPTAAAPIPASPCVPPPGAPHWCGDAVPAPYQPHQPHASRTAGYVPLINSCIASSLGVDGRLTIINNCGQAALVTWGSGNYQRGERVTFTAEVTLPVGETQIWATSSDGSLGLAACPLGMHVMHVATGYRATTAGPDLACR